MSKPPFRFAAGCAAAALAGYLLAYQFPGLGRSDSVRLPGSTHTSNHAGEPESQQQEKHAVTERSPRQLETVKKGLMDLFASSISPESDWTLRAQAGAILATMSAQELEAFAVELTQTGKDWEEFSRIKNTSALLAEVARQWALKSPEKACLFSRGGLWLSSGVFHDWLRRAPEAARAWVIASQFPPGSEKLGANLQQQFLKGQALSDLAAARDSLALLDAEGQQKVLWEWSSRLAHDPAKRADLLALLASRGDTEFTLKCHERLVREMASKSPREAYDFIEDTSLPDEQKHALSQQMLGVWASKHPQAAFAAWAELKETEVPAPLLNAMEDWSLNSPGAEQAIEWVNKLEPGAAREQFKKHMLENMSIMGRFSPAADLARSLEDPIERIRGMRLVKRRWDDEWPKGASEWFKKLPDADKEAILK